MSSLLVQDLVLSRKRKGISKDQNIILKGINASFESGELTAIMGPNGSGKTTLLNILFGLSDSETKTSGNIQYNQKPRDLDTWFKNASYVEQDSFKIIDQTIENMIKFAIEMKSKEFIERDEDEKLENYKSKVSEDKLNEIYEALNLAPILQKNINAVSGGERKRVMIAIELILLKKVLILDEPTSDLDSHLALKLISYLKRIASENDIIVIVTIHQPSDQIFKKFDKILFLIEGKVVFWGKCCDLIEFLASQSILKPSDWTASDFIFEAFYNKSEFKEFKDLSENVSIFLSDITAKSNLIVSSSHLKNKSTKAFFDLNLNLSQSLILMKRAICSILSTKGFYLNLICMVGIISLLLRFMCNIVLNTKLSAYGSVPLSSFPITFPAETTVSDLLFNESISTKNESGMEGREMIYKKIYKECVSSATSYFFVEQMLSLSNFIIGFTSGIFSMKEQFINEVSKGLYSSSTLFLASFCLELLLFMFVGCLLTLVSFSVGFHRILTMMDWMFISQFFALMSLTSHFLNTIFLHPISDTYIIKTILYFLKTIGSLTTFYIIFYDLLKLKIGIAASALRYLFCSMILTFFPGHFLLYLTLSYKILSSKVILSKYFDYIKDINISEKFDSYYSYLNFSYVKIFTDSEVSYKWMICGLFISILLSASLAFIIFGKVFNPRLSLVN